MTISTMWSFGTLEAILDTNFTSKIVVVYPARSPSPRQLHTFSYKDILIIELLFVNRDGILHPDSISIQRLDVECDPALFKTKPEALDFIRDYEAQERL